MFSFLLRNKPYTYKDIEANNQIRLFSFRKTRHADTISIKIEYADIEDPPMYECLSYTWGDSRVRKKILCDHRDLSITTNLWDALQRIRVRVGRERLFWADQISINQRNEEEKSAQVGMMFKIFSKPERVICWLGEEDGYTARACELLREWAKTATDEELRLRLSRLWSSDTGPQTEEQRNDEAALASVFSRAWFRRTWILQEICVSSQLAIMLCGSHDIPWDVVCWAFLMLARTVSSADTIKALSENVRYVLAMFSVFCTRGKHSLRLSMLLKDTARREVSDPRDRYFALLGIMEQEGFTYPAADYSLTTRQVYMRYTRAVIDQDETLCALSPGRLAFPKQDLPTWVLSPEKVESSMPTLWLEDEMLETWSRSSTGATKPLAIRASSPFDPELHLYGLRMDRIEMLYEWNAFARNVSHPQIRWRDILKEAENFVRELGLGHIYERTGEDMVVAFMKTLVRDRFFVGCQQFARAYQLSAERLYNAFVRSDEEHILNEDTANSGIGAGPGRLSNCGFTEKSLYELAMREFCFEKPKAGNHEVIQEDESATASAGFSNVVTWVDAFLSADLVNDWGPFIDNTRLAVTANKSLALVPRAARAGDELCLLLGGFFPFVLRDAGVEGRYGLLGDAYVHGTLDGQSGRECEQLYNAAVDKEDYSGLTKFCLI